MSVNITITVNAINVTPFVQSCDDIPIVARNRDWTPVFDNFNFELSVNVVNPPLKSQLVIVNVDSDPHYLGFIERTKFNEEKQTWTVEVTNYPMKLDPFQISTSVLHEALNKTADFTGAKVFQAILVPNYLLIWSHGYSDGDIIQVRSVGGVLGEPLTDHNYYFVRVIDTDNIQLYTNYADWLASTNVVDLIGGGSGTLNCDLADFSQYVGWLNSDNEDAAVTLKRLVVAMFEIAGMVLDTSLIDNIIFHKFTISAVEYDWHWDEIYLDENMLYCLNQGIAVAPSVIENDDGYTRSQISFLEFIMDLFGKLGIGIKFIGSASVKTYLLFSQGKDADGVRTYDEDVFTIADSDKTDYQEDIIVDEGGGYELSRVFSTDRVDYISLTPVDIEEYTGSIKTNSGRLTIDWFNNLRFYLKDFVNSVSYPIQASYWLLDPNTYGHEFYQIAFYSAVENQIKSIMNHYQEIIVCKAEELSQEVWSVKDLSLDVGDQTIKIIQEENLLASG